MAQILDLDREQVRAHRQHAARGLLETAEMLHGASDPHQVLQSIVEIVADLLPVEAVTLATNEGDHALRRYLWNDKTSTRCAVRLPLLDSLSGWIIRHNRPFRSDDLSSDGIEVELQAPYRLNSVLAIPIVAMDGTVLAALSLHERRDGCP